MHFIAAVLGTKAGAEIKTSTRSAAIAEPATRVEPEAGIAPKPKDGIRYDFWQQM